jgi:peptide/nickel transport system substrate-binding protein
MKKLSKLLIVGALLITISALVIPTAAQDDEGDKVGGIIVDGNFGEGPDTFSPIYCTGTDCADIVNLLFVQVFGVDPETGTIKPNLPGSLATGWEVSDDNLVYTVSLRDDWTWSDGTPITANDVIFNWDLMNNEAAAHPDNFVLEEIENVVALDDYTLEFTMKNATCRALLSAASVRPLPAQVLSQFDVTELETIDFNLAPDVTAGPYVFGEFRPGEITTLLANDDFIDAELGYINNEGFIQQIFADQTVLIEAFLEGELTFLENPPPDRKSDVRAADVQVYDFPGNTWDYMAYNLADPENPQPALDEDGNRIDQGMHPLFSDKAVRQALAHAVDVDAIVEGAVFGEGSRMAAQITPSSWAYNADLAPREYNPELALEMLAEAGWVPDADGNLICEGCLYAQSNPDFEGSPFEFELLTNSGNTRREAIGAIIQDELAQIGITVNFQTIEFNTLLEIMDAQTFDAFILGWRAGYPDSPDTIQLFGAQADLPGSGFNFTSFYNEEYYDLEQQALEVPGCDEADRKPFYDQMQEIMLDEMPYMWLFVQNGMYAAQNNLVNFDPRPQALDWNIDTWALTP